MMSPESNKEQTLQTNGFVSNKKQIFIPGHHVTCKEVPKECRELFLLRSYRYPNYTVLQCLKSLFQMHNETMNCWTHIIAWIYFQLLTIKLLINLISRATQWSEQLPLIIWTAGNSILFAGSSIAHTFNSISVKWRKRVFLLDYSGISFGASGTVLAYCTYLPESVMIMNSKNLYLFICSVLCLIGIIGCSLAMVNFAGSKFAPLMKVCSYGLVAIAGNIPMLNYTMQGSFEEEVHAQTHDQITTMFLIYAVLKLTGGIINATTIPERLKPGSFDCIGHSHQIFHIFIFLAIALQYDLVLMVKNHVSTGTSHSDLIRSFFLILVAWPIYGFTMFSFASRIQNKCSEKENGIKLD